MANRLDRTVIIETVFWNLSYCYLVLIFWGLGWRAELLAAACGDTWVAKTYRPL